MTDIAGVLKPQADAQPQVDSKLVGLGGWLWIPKIKFLVGMPIMGIILILMPFVATADMMENGGWEALPLLIPFCGLFCFYIYIGIQFFGMKKETPNLMVSALVIGLIIDIAAVIFKIFIDTDVDSLRGIGRHLLGVPWAIAWMLYWRRSKRVKATFVN